jgi:hypothetical protein
VPQPSALRVERLAEMAPAPASSADLLAAERATIEKALRDARFNSRWRPVRSA